MIKSITRCLFCLAFFSLSSIKYAGAQTLTIQNFTSGSYTPGSTIAVPFNIGTGACIQQNNTFQLYLADASGNILPGPPLSTYNGFYATFLNGVIPAGTPAGTYTMVVKSTSPAVTSAASPTFTVVAGAAVTAGLFGPSINAANPDVFGVCNGVPNNTFSFFDGSSTGSSVANFFNESTQASDGTVTLANSGNFTAQATNYTVIVQAHNGTDIGNKAFILLNNVVNNAFAVSNSSTVCISSAGGGTLSYNVTTTTSSGIQNNYPGTIYNVTWGDGSTSSYTFCDISNLSGTISHTYTTGSCGNTINGQANSFEVDIQPQSPYCANAVSPLTSYAKVLRSPTNSFTFPPAGCSNTTITFVNTSDPGQDPSATANNCINPNARYTWYVDGVPKGFNYTLAQNFTYSFTTHGLHKITLQLNNGGSGFCTASNVDQYICIQDPPQPNFTLPPSPYCLTNPVIPTDLSVTDTTCANTNTYLWSVTGPGTVSYTGGTNANSHQPHFVFSKEGTYQVTLSIASLSCATTSATQTITVDGPPKITLSPDASVCGTNFTFGFNTSPGITQTNISGTASPQATTYNWVVTGNPNYSFAAGSTANSQYPQITFTGYGTYKVSVTEQNSCGTLTKSQNLSFQNIPVVAIDPVPTVCPGIAFNLNATVNPATYTSLQWSGGTGTFTGSTTLTPTYTPGAADITAGSVTLTLDVKTGLSGTCSDIIKTITVAIAPVDNITSSTSASICTGNTVNYNITANTPGSTFTWTAANTSGTATGFTNGGGNTINDLLINTDPVNVAIVTYTITAHDPGGCTGPPFKLKVKVNPRSVITAVPVSSVVCSGSNGTVNLTPNIAGTTYTWTSAITGSISGNSQQSVPTAAATINDVLSNTGTTAGTVTYTITPYNGNCPGTPVTATLTVQPLPVASNAGPNDEQCNITTYALNGNTPPAGTGRWTVSPTGTVTFDDKTKPNAVASGLVPGTTYKFTWKITIPGCQSSSSNVTVQDDAPSVGGTTAGATAVCSGTNNGSVTLSGQLGNILRWEYSTDNGVTWQPIANTATSQQYLNLTQTTEYRAVVQNGVCSFANSSVSIITVNQPAVTANAGANQELCNVTSCTLGGNNPAPGNGLWTVTSGQSGITFSDPTKPNATVTGLVAGNTYQFTWTITPAAPCAPNSSTVTVTDDAPSDGGTTAGGNTFCAGSSVSGSITLSGQVGNVIRWESSTDNGTSWQQIVNTTTSQSYVNLAQSTLYRAAVQNGLCAFAYSTVSAVTINPAAVLANAGPNKEICNAVSYKLQGNSPSPGTGLWTVTSGQSGITFSDPTKFNATVSGLVAGNTYQFTWTITPAPPCPPTSSSVTITDDLPSVGGTTAGDDTVCAGSNGATITLAGQVGNVLRWESSTDNGNTWQPIVNTLTSLQYLNLINTTKYRAVVQNGVCTFDYSTVTTITVNPLAVVANAGANNEICNATSYKLQGNNPSPGTGLWTVTSGQSGITFSDPTKPNATVSGLVPGDTYQFTWTITPAPPCSPNSSSVTITDDLPSVGGTTAGDATVCAGSNGATINLTGQLGNVLRWESSINSGASWQVIANTSTSLAYLNLNQTTQYRAVVQNGVCAFAYSTVTTITVNQPAVTANAGADQEICNATTYKLKGNNPSPGAGLWTVTSGQSGVTFSDPTKPNATVSGLVPGSAYQFTWTITPALPCTPNSSSVTITDDVPSVGGTTSSNATVCAGSNRATISLKGQLGSVLRWEYSVDNGATWQTIVNTGTTQQYANLNQTTLYRAVVQNGVCAFAYSTVTTITVSQPAIPANAGNDQEICNATSYVLQGNNPVPAAGLWTITSGQTGITFSDPTKPNATVSGLIPGNTYQFTWTITPSAPCTPNASTVTITDDAPTAGGTIAGSKAFCAGPNISGKITLSGQVGTILKWEFSTDNGVTWQPLGNTTATQQYVNLRQTTQYRAVVQNGVCAFAYSTVAIITVNPPATPANAGTNQELCNITTYTLKGNNPAPATGLWTVTSGQTGVIFADPTKPNTTVSGLVPGNNYEFTWTITPLAPCTPNSSSVVIADDAPSSGGTTSSDDTVCAGSNGATITLMGQVGGVLRWESSIDNGTTWQTIVNTAATQQYLNLVKTTQYRAVVKSGLCSIAYSTVTTITVNPPPIQANAGNNQQLCGATTMTLQGNDPTPFIGVWTQTAGPAATIVSPGNYQTQVTGLVPGNDYTFLWTIKGLPPCPDSSDPVQVHDQNDVIASFTADKTDGCGSYTVNFTNTSTALTGTNFQWDFGDGSAPSNAVSPSHTFLPRTDGKDTVYTVSLNILNNCQQRAPYTVDVTVRPDTPLVYIVPQQIVGCSPFTIAVDNFSPGNNQSYTYYLYDGSALVQKIVKTDKSEVRFDPVVTTKTKTYTLYMVATGYCGNTGQTNLIPITISVTDIIAQMFIENNTNKGCAPLTVTFVNNSVGADSYYYTIYDVNHNVVDRRQGGTAPMPYTFNTPGTYYVTVTAMNSCNTVESTPPIRVDVYPSPAPAFVADVTSGCKNLTVNFTNQTPDDPNTQAISLIYDWDFGDGSQHAFTFTPPPHLYNYKNSPFTVTLTATNAITNCSTVVSKTAYINVASPPGTEFTEKPDSVINIPNYKFSFIDETTGGPVAWNWAFGDGQTSTHQNPEHTYADTGLYKVTLTTANQLGCDSSATHYVRITGIPGQLYLPNAFEPDGTDIELRTFKAKGSGIKEWHMQIFNNFAQLVWETTKLDSKGAPVEGWDGTFKGQPAPQGVYVWEVSATFINGTKWKGNVIKNSLPKTIGVVHLIR